MANPPPGTGVTYDPNEEKEVVKLSPSSVTAGIQQPEGRSKLGQLIKQIPVEEAEAELDELNVEEWIRKHYDKKDFNIQKMAEVLRETTQDIYDRLHAYGYELPEGTYSK